jgi:pimeloyl-ACP methyl ester carboxylesterase
MKKFISIIFCLGSLALVAQEDCRPQYGEPVKTIALSQGPVAYIEKGKGPAIIFIHGLGGNLSHWSKVSNQLSAEYCCIILDLPGYGRSGKITGTNGKDQLQFYADAINEFLVKKKIRKAVLAGHSMGAQVAMISALQNKRVKKLILAAPAGLETFSEKEAQLLIASTPAAVFEKQDEVAIRANFKMNFFQLPPDAESLIQDRLRLKTCPDFNTYCEIVSLGVKGMLAHPVKNELKNIQQPTLILFGAKDALIPNKFLHPSLTIDELVSEARGLLPASESKIIEGAGHMLPWEKSSEMAEAIKAFLR